MVGAAILQILHSSEVEQRPLQFVLNFVYPSFTEHVFTRWPLLMDSVARNPVVTLIELLEIINKIMTLDS